MKANRIIWLLFACLLFIQLVVPAYMIFDRELVLRTGKELKFKVEPIDPYHPFKGRYVSVNIGNTEIPVSEDEKYYGGQTVYGVIETDSRGFSSISGIAATPPEGKDYFKTKVSYIYGDGGERKVQIKPPFDRYYMEENLAPLAEREYNKRTMDEAGRENVYVTVKLLKGSVVLERLYIEGITVEEYIKKGLN